MGGGVREQERQGRLRSQQTETSRVQWWEHAAGSGASAPHCRKRTSLLA